MPPLFQKPSLARFSSILAGLVIGLAATFAQAQTLPEIQRLMKQGQLPQALEKIDAYVSSKPKDAPGRFLRGLILTEMGKSAEAIAVFSKLTEDFPELPEPYNNLAVLYAQQKQYDKARTALEMAIRTHPSYAIAHENLGDVYAKLASQAYDKALQLDSSNAATQSKLSMIKEMIGGASAANVKPAAAPEKMAAVEAAKPAAPPHAAAPPAKPEPAPPAKTVEAQPAPQKLAAEESAAASAAAEAEVGKALQNWAAAWSRKDVKAYLGHYAADFQTPNGMSRKAWEAERAQRIDKPGKLQVRVENVRVSLAGDKATVRFRQNYVSTGLKSSANKTVVFVKSGGKWLIQQERVG